MFRKDRKTLYISMDILTKEDLKDYKDIKNIIFTNNLIRKINADAFIDLINLESINYPSLLDDFLDLIINIKEYETEYGLRFAHKNEITLKCIDEIVNINSPFTLESMEIIDE